MVQQTPCYKCLLREDHRLVVFKNRVLRKTLETEGGGTSRGREILFG
jgi:hypothetical protein